MAILTENGWTVIDAPGASFVAPNGWRVDVRDEDTAIVFGYIAKRWHEEIEPITRIGGWRKGTPIAGTSRMSNHTAGLAMDINPHLHTYEFTRKRAGLPYIETFTEKQIDTLHGIQKDLQRMAGSRVITLGIDYRSPRRDGMHVEVRCTAAVLKRAADVIRAAQKKDDAKPQEPAWADGVLKNGDRGEPVEQLQKFFLAVFPSYESVKAMKAGYGADGVFGAELDAVVAEFQERVKIKADSVVGANTIRHLEKYGYKK